MKLEQVHELQQQSTIYESNIRTNRNEPDHRESVEIFHIHIILMNSTKTR